MEAVCLLIRLTFLLSTATTGHFAIIIHHVLTDKAVGVLKLNVFEGLKEDLLFVLLLREIIITSIIIGLLFKVYEGWHLNLVEAEGLLLQSAIQVLLGELEPATEGGVHEELKGEGVHLSGLQTLLDSRFLDHLPLDFLYLLNRIDL